MHGQIARARAHGRSGTRSGAEAHQCRPGWPRTASASGRTRRRGRVGLSCAGNFAVCSRFTDHTQAGQLPALLGAVSVLGWVGLA
eukprot:2893766-Prymnesium_polylepis.1